MYSTFLNSYSLSSEGYISRLLWTSATKVGMFLTKRSFCRKFSTLDTDISTEAVWYGAVDFH